MNGTARRRVIPDFLKHRQTWYKSNESKGKALLVCFFLEQTDHKDIDTRLKTTSIISVLCENAVSDDDYSTTKESIDAALIFFTQHCTWSQMHLL